MSLMDGSFLHNAIHIIFLFVNFTLRHCQYKEESMVYNQTVMSILDGVHFCLHFSCQRLNRTAYEVI
jgi:hypothetical protein